jgi:hypothetical protein
MRRQFEIKSGRMVISDPCYELNLPVNAIINNVKKGKWDSIVITSEDNRFIEKLIVYNIDSFISGEFGDYEIKNIQDEANLLPYEFGVDSGQFGFFDFEGYGNNKKCERLKKFSKTKIQPENPFYSICCDRVSSGEGWGTLPFGVVSTSGGGDGTYEVYGLKNSNEEFVFFVADFRNAIWEIINLIKTK